MTVEEKVDVLLNAYRLDVKLFKAREEKNNNVRKQDFEAAVKSREKEKSIMDEIEVNAALIDSLLSGEQNAQASVATEADSSTDDDPIKKITQ